MILLSSAQAFCGFYVGGAGQELYNDATVVVMMRDGTKTVLSMQNTYAGPPEGFAMVVPVPEVLDKADVKTLPASLFAKVDQLAAPRLVEYWEQDPCRPIEMLKGARGSGAVPLPKPVSQPSPALGVTVEAQFEVGEYDIVILSAKDSGGLETWLKREKYAIPDGAETALRGYVAQGTKFFVAKVDPERVTFEGGRAVLSPLRMAYDSETFQLPIRLGMLNAKGDQDLLVHILAKERYEVANLPNITIPTNLIVSDPVKGDFGSFYEALFVNARSDAPGAVVTEYAWAASTCDPCPGPTMSEADMLTLGGDVVKLSARQATLTRLHHRYNEKAGGEDLVFKKAAGIAGGRGTPDGEGKLGSDISPSTQNQFQGRYAILHRWEGEATCDEPRPASWGGPPAGGVNTALAAPGRLRGGTQKAAPNLSSMIIGKSSALPGNPVPIDPEAADDGSTEREPMCSTVSGSVWLLLFTLPLLRRTSSRKAR